MMTKQEFLKAFQKHGINVKDSVEEIGNFDDLADAAWKVKTAMPSIGFGSVTARMNCFLAVCRHLDTLIDDGEIDLSGSQIVLNILRLKDRKFRKAITMFDLRGTRFGVLERAEMPRSAREYLAGLEICR